MTGPIAAHATPDEQASRPEARSPRWLAPTTVVLGLAVLALGLLGPLATGVIRYRVAPLLRDQLIGSDAVSVVVFVPLLLLAAVLTGRRSPVGPLLALGSALTSWYFVAELVLGPDRTGRYAGNDEAYLPLLLAVLLLSAAVALGAWQALPERAVVFDRRSRGVIGGLLLGVVTLFVVGRYLPAWQHVVAGTAPSDYAAGPGIWWTVAFEDLALLLPATAATGIGLLRGTRWAGRAAFVVAPTLALVGVAVTGMAWSTTAHGDAGSTVWTAVLMTLVGLVSASPALVCWLAFARSGDRRYGSFAVSARPPRAGTVLSPRTESGAAPAVGDAARRGSGTPADRSLR
jgi:hypothetical protein